MPDKMSKNMLNRMSEDLSDKISKNMLNGMSKNIPSKMSNEISNKKLYQIKCQ